jgi:hypothetical protein
MKKREGTRYYMFRPKISSWISDFALNLFRIRSRGNVVGIMTKLQVGLSGVRMPTKARYFSLLQKFQTPLGPTQLPAQYWGS